MGKWQSPAFRSKSIGRVFSDERQKLKNKLFYWNLHYLLTPKMKMISSKNSMEFHTPPAFCSEIVLPISCLPLVGYQVVDWRVGCLLQRWL